MPPSSTPATASPAFRPGKPLRPRGPIVVFAIALAVAGLFAWLGWQRFMAPRPAPAVSFQAIDGERIELAALRGQVVMVEFWATTCVICMREMPDVAALARELAPRGLATIAVAMPYDRPDHVIAYAKRNRLPFAVALDPMGKALEAFGPIPGTPTRFIVARDGTIAATLVGAGSERLRARLDKELARPVPAAAG